jgi:hypothetical protein
MDFGSRRTRMSSMEGSMKSSSIALLSVLFLTVFSSLSFAQPGDLFDDPSFGCVENSLAQRYVQEFRIDVASFGGLELCNNSSDTKKLFNDLQIIEKGTFQAFGSNKLIKGFIPQDKYFSWMKSQTRSINRGDDIPFATAYNSFGNFTMQDGWAILSTLGRVGTVIHEARHTAGYSHTRCNQGPYSDTSVSGCDRTYNEGGSHGVEMEYYARVSVLGANFHPAYKAMARLMAMGRTNFVFNQSPIQKREALVVVDGNKVLLMDQGQTLERDLALGNSEKLKTTSFGAALFDGVKAFALELYEDGFGPVRLVDDYSYFKMLRQDRGQGQVLDFEEVDQGAKRFVVVLNQQSQITQYNFGQGKFNPYRTTGLQAQDFWTTSPAGERGLFVRTQSGALHKVNLGPQLTLSPLKMSWDSETLDLASVGNSTLRLNTQGDLQELKAGQWTSIPGIRGDQITTVPLYDAFVVE